MTTISPKKLLHSKWTAVSPQHREKHFLVTEVQRDAQGVVISCTIEAVHSRKESQIPWRDLKDREVWKAGWQ